MDKPEGSKLNAEDVVDFREQVAVGEQSGRPSSISPIRVAVLGAGGLGKAAARIIGMKRDLRLVAVCDSKGVVFDPEGLDCTAMANHAGDLVSWGGSQPSSSRTPLMEQTDDPVGRIMELADHIDGMLLTLPNMPNEFIPGVIERCVRTSQGLVFVDVLKRTAAVEQTFALGSLVKSSRSVVLTGCGATPGLLTAAAVLAAQSFIEVERVDIWWGVGIANWDAYKATIREDIAHVPGFSVEQAKAMTDEAVEAFLAPRNGLLELHHMEHADDVLLERVGVVHSQNQVEVGGVMDTRHPKKPVSTTMTLTGITFEGKRASHRFLLGDETSMAANVVGPALGYLARGLWLKAHGIFGVFGSTEFLPMVVR